jgi:hypothetical protein
VSSASGFLVGNVCVIGYANNPSIVPDAAAFSYWFQGRAATMRT